MSGADADEAMDSADHADRMAEPTAIEDGSEAGQMLRVTRTGGIAGVRRSGEIDLAGDDPRAAEACELLSRSDLAALDSSPPQPDRFQFEFHTPQASTALGEQDLTDDLRRLAALVLDD